jgi:hypothetical protein
MADDKTKKEKRGFFKQGLEDLKDSTQTVVDDAHMILGTKRGEMKKDYLDKKYPYRGGTGLKSGGMVSASKRADGCAKKGKTKGRMV